MQKMFAQCAKCNKICEGKGQVKKYFGIRIMNCKEKPQSYCKECRAEHTRQINSVKKMLKREGYYDNK